MRKGRSRQKFPWIPFLLLLASAYGLWILPHQLPAEPMKIDFVPPASR